MEVKTIFRVNFYTFLAISLVAFILCFSKDSIAGEFNESWDREEIPLDIEDYLVPTFKNFEYILWRFEGYDYDNDEDLKRFIALNDCELFKRYQNYDLEWEYIVPKYKRYLKSNYKRFPSKVRVEIPIGLLRYNEEQNLFEMSEETQFNAVRVMPIKRFGGDVEPCNIQGSWIANYHRFLLNNVNISLKHELNLTEVPVPYDLAIKYIELVERYAGYHHKVEGRLAFAYFYVVFHDYIRRVADGGHLLYGEIEDIEIYADRERTMKLYSFDPRKESLSREVKRKGTVTDKPATAVKSEFE